MLAAVFFQQLHIFRNYYCNWNKTNKQTLLLHLVDEVLQASSISLFYWYFLAEKAQNCLFMYLFVLYLQ